MGPIGVQLSGPEGRLVQERRHWFVCHGVMEREVRAMVGIGDGELVVLARAGELLGIAQLRGSR